MSYFETESRLDFYRFLPPKIKRELDIILLNTDSLPSEIHLKIGKSSAVIDGNRINLSAKLELRDIEKIFNVFASDPLVTCSLSDARKCFDEMVENTKKYLTDYNL